MDEVTLQLSNEVMIRDAVALARAKFRRFHWEWYDGVVTDPDAIEPTDFAITIAMNSWASAQRMREFMRRRRALERRLRRVPRNAHLAPDTPDRVFNAVAALFEEACQAKGTKLAVASKVLHRKRPSLIPMLDTIVVDGHYWPFLKGTNPPAWFDRRWLKIGASSDPTMYMRAMAEELATNRDSLSTLRQRLVGCVPPTISDVRLLEVTLYAHLLRRASRRRERTR